MNNLSCFGRYDADNEQCIRCNDKDCIHLENIRQEKELLDLQDLRIIFNELEKKVFL